jgi:hypothetical protein
MPDRSSARSPTTAAMRARVWRKATCALRAKSQVARAMRGSTRKASSASRGLMESMTTTMPPSMSASPMRVMRPSESSSLMTATSLMSREMVTPTMWVS